MYYVFWVDLPDSNGKFVFEKTWEIMLKKPQSYANVVTPKSM